MLGMNKPSSIMMLKREHRFKNFKAAMAFAARVGDLAEEQQHHPDLHVAWGKVGADIWTHKIGESDVVFAAKCDALYSTVSIKADLTGRNPTGTAREPAWNPRRYRQTKADTAQLGMS